MSATKKLLLDNATSSAAATGAWDVERIREDFPVLRQTVNGKPLVYLDNAASSQVPQVVIDRGSIYLEHEHSNIHRGVHYEPKGNYRLRGRARESETLHKRARSTRVHLRTWYDRRHQSGNAGLRTEVYQRSRRDHHHCDGTPRQYRSLADAL